MGPRRSVMSPSSPVRYIVSQGDAPSRRINMTTGSQVSSVSSASETPALDLKAVKARQQAMWASGDFAVIGTTLQLVGELLCEAVDLRAGQRVLDVACGNGHASL